MPSQPAAFGIRPDGRAAARLTEFADGTMATFDWSQDGTILARTRVSAARDVAALDLHSTQY